MKPTNLNLVVFSAVSSASAVINTFACLCLHNLGFSPIQAERATREALASFGGTGLGSIAVRKIDLHNQLKREAEKMKDGEKAEDGVEDGPPAAKRPRTRYTCRVIRQLKLLGSLAASYHLGSKQARILDSKQYLTFKFLGPCQPVHFPFGLFRATPACALAFQTV
jgi:hypothetical protein